MKTIPPQVGQGRSLMYSEIFSLLKPGGVFVNVEHIAPDSAWNEELFSQLFVDSSLVIIPPIRK